MRHRLLAHHYLLLLLLKLCHLHSMLKLSLLQETSVWTLHSWPPWEKPCWGGCGTRPSNPTVPKSGRKLGLRSPNKRLPLRHTDRHSCLGHHGWVLAHHLCSLLANYHLARHLGKHVRCPRRTRMSWIKKARALLMLLLLASVLCYEIGVLLLLLPYLTKNSYENK